MTDKEYKNYLFDVGCKTVFDVEMGNNQTEQCEAFIDLCIEHGRRSAKADIIVSIEKIEVFSDVWNKKPNLLKSELIERICNVK